MADGPASNTDTDAPEFLTVRELAALLRLKERKIYDLAASGAVPCTKVTGKLLFPAAAVRAWIASGTAAPAQPVTRPAVFLGSHDPLLDWALRQSRCGLASYFDGSGDGLRRFVAGEGVATGLHIHGPTGWNTDAVAEAGVGNAVLIGFAARTRGLVLRAGTAISGLGDLVAGARFVPRQSGSGSQVLFDHLCAQAGIAAGDIQTTETAHSESDAVQSVVQGHADVTFGLQALAHPYALPFVPLVQERFDLLIDRKTYFDPALQTLMTFLHSDAFARHATNVAGYDMSDLGRVRWNG